MPATIHHVMPESAGDVKGAVTRFAKARDANGKPLHAGGDHDLQETRDEHLVLSHGGTFANRVIADLTLAEFMLLPGAQSVYGALDEAKAAAQLYVPCFEVKPGTGTHQPLAYQRLKDYADKIGQPFALMTLRRYPYDNSAAAKGWEASAVLRIKAMRSVGLPCGVLWHPTTGPGSIIADPSDPLLLVMAWVKAPPPNQPFRDGVVVVPQNSATYDIALAHLMKVAYIPATPTPNPEVPMTTYPGADVTTQWFYDKFGGSPMHPNVTVLHTTEGGGWPDYAGGSMAPTLTVMADKATKKLKVRQHFPLERSARALVNLPGGVETNTLNDINIELVGTCDPAHKDGYGAIYWPDAPEWCYVELGKLLAELHRLFPAIRLVAGGKVVNGHWPAYPASINANRMSAAEWSNFTGICGHQHVPENVHGDPGALPIAKILAYAKGGTPPVPAPAPKPVTRGPRIDAAIAAAHTTVAQLKLANRPSAAATVAAALAAEQQVLTELLTIPPIGGN